jgi:glycosyltransferase involved in cell wall biosynthesis
MKLLYITNGSSGSGGLERVLAVKASYLVDKLNYEVHILTLNDGDNDQFYEFNTNITFHDIKVEGNPFNYFVKYRNGIRNLIRTIKPDVISVCDDGLKGMLFPLIFGKSIPCIYERHVSKQIEVKEEHQSIVSKLKSKVLFWLMNYGGSQFDKFVVLTNRNIEEWELDNLGVIPNPLPFNTTEKSTLKNKKVLVVGKQGYQKSYDRLLQIWALVNQQFPDWELEVYGKMDSRFGLDKLASELNIKDTVHFYPPTRNIQEKYKEASLYLMTSRFEGFGMVLIEAMVYGVPCVSFDCPHGPADIITNEEDGFLIENGDKEGFANAIIRLIENEDLRKDMGAKAKDNVQRYAPQNIITLWDEVFKDLVNN